MVYHPVQPQVGTTVRETDGQPASLMKAADYPVLGDCMGCGCRIRLQQFNSPAWTHVEHATAERKTA